MFAADDRVRLKHDPAQVGLIVSHTPTERGGRLFYQVRLGDGARLIPAAQLEPAPLEVEPVDDLVAGKFASAQDLRRSLTHLRMTGRLADMIYSLGATNTEFHAYQFKPVLKLLNAPSRGVLIADEVGLGKTIEAGLVWTELVARFDCRRLLVVCPKPLVPKWREELRSKFSVDARAADAAELLRGITDDSESGDGFAFVASLNALRPPSGWDERDDRAGGARADLARYFADRAEDTLFDLVIIDEAHHLRNAATANHELGQLLASVADHRLLLSATPINLRQEELRVLLKLLDPDTFERDWIFDQLMRENEPLVAAWEAARDPRTPLADLVTVVRELPEGSLLKTGERLRRLRDDLDGNVNDSEAFRADVAARLEELSLLGSIVNRTRRRDIADRKVERRPVTASWEMSPVEREFYDEASEAIADYAFMHDISERFLLAQTQRLLASSLPAAHAHWGSKAGGPLLDDDDGEWERPGRLIAHLAPLCANPGRLATLEEADSKLERLRYTLTSIWASEPTAKLIIFSSFRRTIDYLGRRLGNVGIATLPLHGGIKEERTETIARFADHPGPAVLLTSEVGGEGLDLQFCRIIINYDLPWNPMKVEQRIGRIDRIGQASPSIDIVNLIAANTIEEQVYERLYMRLGLIKAALGDFEPILGEVVQAIELVLANPELDDEGRAKELDRAALAAEERRRQSEVLEREAPGLVAHGDMILRRVEEANAPHRMLTSEEIRDYVVGTIVSSYEGSRFEPVDGVEIDVFDVRLSPRAQADFSRFIETSARKYPTLFRRDAASGVRIVFGRNPDPSRFRRIEAVSITHPLARFAARIRAEATAGLVPKPVVSIHSRKCADVGLSPGRYVVAVQHWSADALVPLDKLTVVGSTIRGELIEQEDAERLLSSSLSAPHSHWDIDRATAAAAASVVESLLKVKLNELRDRFEDGIAADHYDRCATQRALITQHLDHRRRQIEKQIHEYRLANRDRMVPALRGKLAKLEAKMDQRLRDIERREVMLEFKDSGLVGIAVIELH